MRIILGLAPFLLASLAWAINVELQSADPSHFKIELSLAARDIQPDYLRKEGTRYLRLVHSEGLDLRAPGEPEIPRVHRYLVIPPQATYEIHVKLADVEKYVGIELYPTQPDYLETVQNPPFVKDKAAYERNAWIGGRGVIVGKRVQVGGVTLLPVTFYPARYNPKKKRLDIFQTIHVELVAKNKAFERKYSQKTISHFAESESSVLALNGQAVAKPLRNSTHTQRLLVVSPKALMYYAKLAGIIHEKQGTEVVYLELPTGLTSTDVKTRIKTLHTAKAFDALLLWGDETYIPMAVSSGYYGDYAYSLLDGTDSLSDLAVGRYPVSDDKEAKIIVGKLERQFLMSKRQGQAKKVLLIAHREQFPGKYTANMEKLKALPNPKGFEFQTQFGGAGALNVSVQKELEQRHLMVFYRGHGDYISWWQWDKNQKSFGDVEMKGVSVNANLLPIFFNISCLNGAIQSKSTTWIETQLFPSKELGEMRGPVAAVGASAPSETLTNDSFAIHLATLSQNEGMTLGALHAGANNKLTQENGGQPPNNVRMYMLFGDPLLPLE